MAIENSVSNDFWSTIVDSIDVFDCRLSGVTSKLDKSFHNLTLHEAPDQSVFTKIAGIIWIWEIYCMRGSRNFCQRESNVDNFYFIFYLFIF